MNREQTLCFCAAVLLSGHGFKVNWICLCRGGVGFRWLRWGEWAGQKIGNYVFQTRKIQNLQIEFRDESQMALLSR